MVRIFTVHGITYNIDDWCESHIDEKTNLVDALRMCLTDYPDLNILKSQVRGAIKYWQTDKQTLFDLGVDNIEVIEV